MTIEDTYNGNRSIIEVLCGISHHLLRVFMLRIFSYIVCDIPHYIRKDTRSCLLYDAYNGYRIYL
jgi:hypothetical protein